MWPVVVVVDRGGPTVSSFSLGVVFVFSFLPSLFYFSVVLLVLFVITLPRYDHESFSLSPSLYAPYNYNLKNKVTTLLCGSIPAVIYISVYISGDKRSPCNRFSRVVKLRYG